MTQRIHFERKMKANHSKNGKGEFLVFVLVFNTSNMTNVDNLLNWDRLRPNFRAK